MFMAGSRIGRSGALQAQLPERRHKEVPPVGEKPSIVITGIFPVIAEGSGRQFSMAA
jgi:hypothetical protein